MRLASGLHVEDDVEVEITEDDLNDPSLLAELEDLDEDKPRSGETLASLQSKLTAETQKCLSLKRAGRTEEVSLPRHVLRPTDGTACLSAVAILIGSYRHRKCFLP
jgi:hypothetical protein